MESYELILKCVIEITIEPHVIATKSIRLRAPDQKHEHVVLNYLR